MSPELAVEVRDIGKRFGDVQALDGVSLGLARGSVHALLGENGAGKSTLVKCIMGYHRPDAGEVLVDGRRVVARSPRDAHALGIGMVYQHFTLVPNMTVAENLVLARAKLPFFIDWRAELDRLEAFMARMPFAVRPELPVRTLSAGEKQKVEILKQLYLRSRVLILDEPTSVLTPAESDAVLGTLHDLAKQGSLSILLITHKFREVTRYADEVTVLRRGRVTGSGAVGRLTARAMAEMMVGGGTVESVRPPAAAGAGDVRLRVEALEADDDLGVRALRGVTFDVRAGEIVGIAAVAGNGQEELVEVLAGQRAHRCGRVLVSGREYSGSRAEARALRVRCLPEEPLRNACVASMSVAENMAFRSFDERPLAFARFGLSRAAMHRAASRMIADFGVRTPSTTTRLGALSGGNVQRAVLARELAGAVDVLVAENPCMGLDFTAVHDVHGRIRSARAAGAGVLLVSADLDEVLALADRVLVMSEGRVVHETAADAADLAALGQYMAGHSHP